MEPPKKADSRDAAPSPKAPKKPSLVERFVRKLESKRRRLKREDPHIYPLF
jgi:hypothetical protein